MAFPDALLDDIKARVTLEAVARAGGVALKKEGSEWKALSPFVKEKTPSFTINEQKKIWKCFSSGKGSNDIFSLHMALANVTFVRAVEDLAAMAGVQLPGKPSPGARSTAPAQQDQGDAQQEQAAPQQPRGKRTLTKVYDYPDADGGLIYQVCRFQFQLPNGAPEKDDRGRIKKTFAQRRPYAGEPGRFVWGLGAGEYMRKGPSADWYAFNEQSFERWGYRERIAIEDSVEHGLYRFDELVEERSQGDDARIIWLPEGEKDADTLVEWGLFATTNSGGAKNWRDYHAQQFFGLCVVIPIDNDKAGRERGHKVALSLRGIAKWVKVLDPRDYWSDAPEGGDITDWKVAANGSRDKLMAVLAKTPDWTPAPPESAFNAQRFVDLDRPGREYEWLIKNLITRGETSVWYGPPSCGKSFLITDAALHVARGNTWFGQRVRQGLVIYIAAEGGLGLRKRLRAWRKAFGVTADENVPFVLLPTPVNIFANDIDLQKLLIEIKAWAAFYDVPLELIVFDTLAAVTPGANENSSEHMGMALSRTRKLAMDTGAHVALVHHTPAQGDNPRGWTGIVGNVENVIQIVMTDQVDFEEGPGGEKQGRKLRSFVTRKQKDEESDFTRNFVLKQVLLGQDPDGDPITSCIVGPVYGASQMAQAYGGGNKIVPAGYKVMGGNNFKLMRALALAFKEKRVANPPGVKCPEMTYCVKVADWQEAMRTMLYTNDPSDPDGIRLRRRVSKAVERTYDGGTYDWTSPKMGLIGKDKEWVWRTDQKVHEIDPPPPPPEGRRTREDEPMLLAPGEDPASLGDDMFTR